MVWVSCANGHSSMNILYLSKVYSTVPVTFLLSFLHEMNISSLPLWARTAMTNTGIYALLVCNCLSWLDLLSVHSERDDELLGGGELFLPLSTMREDLQHTFSLPHKDSVWLDACGLACSKADMKPSAVCVSAGLARFHGRLPVFTFHSWMWMSLNVKKVCCLSVRLSPHQLLVCVPCVKQWAERTRLHD